MPSPSLTDRPLFAGRHLHGRLPISIWLAMGAMSLIGCGSSAPQPRAAHAPTDHTTAQATAAQGGELAAESPAEARSQGSDGVIAQPITMPPEDAATARVPPADQASYAGRADAQQLADELASRHDLPVPWTRDALAQARYRDVVARLIMPAANPGAKNWAAYRSRFVEPQRLRAGQRFLQEHAGELQRAEDRYGVPANIIAGVIGVETLYGRDTGRFRVLDALTTLSLDFPKGRSDRSAFFRQELGEFLVMCREQGL